MHVEALLDKQIDRACAAQSDDMMPKLPPSPEEKAAKKKQIQAQINAKFNHGSSG